MISIADTYDVMTARDSYRDPVSQAEAIAELRRVSGAQLDGELVEAFIRLARAQRRCSSSTRRTPTSSASSTSTPRVRGYALPQAA